MVLLLYVDLVLIDRIVHHDDWEMPKRPLARPGKSQEEWKDKHGRVATVFEGDHEFQQNEYVLEAQEHRFRSDLGDVRHHREENRPSEPFFSSSSFESTGNRVRHRAQ